MVGRWDFAAADPIAAQLHRRARINPVAIADGLPDLIAGRPSRSARVTALAVGEFIAHVNALLGGSDET
jgi:hypothetical protein